MRISKLSPGRRTEHEHGWHTVATQYGRPTSPHAPKEHRTRPTTTWDDYPAMETMHRTAQPRQHASDRGQQAQRTHRPTTHTSTGKRRPHRHTQAWCKGSRAAAARRTRGASATSRSDQKSLPSRTLQADLPAAELQAPRPARRGWCLLERMERRMSLRPSGWKQTLVMAAACPESHELVMVLMLAWQCLLLLEAMTYHLNGQRASIMR